MVARKNDRMFQAGVRTRRKFLAKAAGHAVGSPMANVLVVGGGRCHILQAALAVVVSRLFGCFCGSPRRGCSLARIVGTEARSKLASGTTHERGDRLRATLRVAGVLGVVVALVVHALPRLPLAAVRIGYVRRARRRATAQRALRQAHALSSTRAGHVARAALLSGRTVSTGPGVSGAVDRDVFDGRLRGHAAELLAGVRVRAQAAERVLVALDARLARLALALLAWAHLGHRREARRSFSPSRVKVIIN